MAGQDPTGSAVKIPSPAPRRGTVAAQRPDGGRPAPLVPVGIADGPPLTPPTCRGRRTSPRCLAGGWSRRFIQGGSAESRWGTGQARTLARRVWTEVVGRIGVAVLAAAVVPAAAVAGELEVVVSGLRSTDGAVRIGLFTSAERFADRTSDHSADAPASVARALFTDLPAGRYGIAVYHDENANHRHDMTLIGLPAEGYGFANDAFSFFGPPGFDEMVVEVPADGRVVAPITLRY